MKKEEPIKQIRRLLDEHEEAYQLGAWENFKSHRNRKQKRFLWKSIAAAAAVLIVISLSVAMFSIGEDGAGQIADGSLLQAEAERVPSVVPESAPQVDRSDARPQLLEQITRTEEPVTVQASQEELHQETKEQPLQTGTGMFLERELIPGNDLTHAESRLRQIADYQRLAFSKELPVETAAPFTEVYHISKEDIIQAGEPRNTFSMGVAYSPLLNISGSGTDFSSGVGLSAGWQIDQGLALTSGFFVSRSRLEFNNNNKIAVTNSNDRVFDSVDMEANFLTLDIPLNLRYSVTEHFFIGAGVSSVSFIRERYSYTYRRQESVQRLEQTVQEGFQVVREWITFTETTEQEKPSLSTFYPAAFYNISLGYVFNISERSRFSFEPFVKIPTRTISAGNVNYTTGGMQLTLIF